MFTFPWTIFLYEMKYYIRDKEWNIYICVSIILYTKTQLKEASFYTYTKATYTTPKAAPLPKEGENCKYVIHEYHQNSFEQK